MKKRIWLFVVAAFILQCVLAVDKPDWENESVNGINREPARADFIPFAGMAAKCIQAIDDVCYNPYQLSLNGLWRFNWVPEPSQRPLNFYQTDFNDATWKEL